MTSIKCQDCKPEDECCITCGGYKEVLCKVKTQCCGKEYWTRPGVSTRYKGKRWSSFDGLRLIEWNMKTICLECWIKEDQHPVIDGFNELRIVSEKAPFVFGNPLFDMNIYRPIKCGPPLVELTRWDEKNKKLWVNTDEVETIVLLRAGKEVTRITNSEVKK